MAETKVQQVQDSTTSADTVGGIQEGANGETPQNTPDAAAVGATTPDSGNKEVTVRIPQGSSELTENAYTPNPVEVNVGDTVTWINDDITPHTATSGSSSSGSTGMFGGTDDSPEIIRPDVQASHYIRRSWCVQIRLHSASKHGRNVIATEQ